MVTIIFEAHSTTYDSEQHLSSGHNDADLSPLGLIQAKDLGMRYKDDNFGAIFCSDLQRSYKTAEIAFGHKFPIIKDRRLRECDYGDLTKHLSGEVESEKINHISSPFPNGESYHDTSRRMKAFLEDLLRLNNNKVMIIGHRATKYGLDHWINKLSLERCITNDWQWQPGWTYRLDKI